MLLTRTCMLASAAQIAARTTPIPCPAVVATHVSVGDTYDLTREPLLRWVASSLGDWWFSLVCVSHYGQCNGAEVSGVALVGDLPGSGRESLAAVRFRQTSITACKCHWRVHMSAQPTGLQLCSRSRPPAHPAA